jgi:hypothetical protein
MENASKALIIAGAILLSIIIISLGIMVVNNARNQIGGADLSSTEATAFNSKWEPYEGTTKTLNEVKTLLQAVRTHNATENSTTKRFIMTTNTGTANTTTQTTLPTLIEIPTSASKTYTVKLGYDTNTGLVVGIDVKQNP